MPFTSPLALAGLILIPAVIVLLVWLVWPYLESADAQVRHQQEGIIKLAADRDWDAVTGRMSYEYEDQWSMNRTDSVALAQELLQGFLALDIEWTTAEITVNGNIAKVRGTVKMTGSGVGASSMVLSRVNSIQEPWVFTWRKDGWKPSGWHLRSLKNAELGGPLPENALR